MAKEFYVYLHRRKDNNEVFYVGKGRRYRAYNKHGRSQWWKSIETKYGRIVEFVETGLEEQDAFDLEIETIRFYRENGHNLCNMREGGVGYAGNKFPEKTRKVFCSNGKNFNSCGDAIDWLIEEGHKDAEYSVVYNMCAGHRTSMFAGLMFSFKDEFYETKITKIWENVLTSLGVYTILESHKHIPIKKKERIMPQIGDYVVTSNNGSVQQSPKIRVKKDGVILAQVIFDGSKRASDPMGFVQRNFYVDDYAAEKRKELIDQLTHAGVPEEDIAMLLKVN